MAFWKPTPLQIISSDDQKILFRKEVMDTASTSGDVILTLVDESYLDITINFHRLSIKANNISNILYVSLSENACDVLKAHFSNIRCHVLSIDITKEGSNNIINLSQSATEYGSVHFINKMIIRTWFVLEALSTERNILLTDVDLVYFKDPLPYFTCKDCDLEVMDDCVPSLYVHCYCGGFIYIRPTVTSIKVFQKILYWQTHTDQDDQVLLNHVIQKEMKDEVHFKVLSKRSFVCGLQYYERERRFFADDRKCKSCVVAHNNWIVSKAAKMYRFRELHHWLLEESGYYSDKSRKYIIYRNAQSQKYNADVCKVKRVKTIEQQVMDKNAVKYQTDGLKAALEMAFILNRTLILPKFYCQSCECPLNALYHVTTFDTAFYGLYREHSFLSHRDVPEDIKEDISLPHRIIAQDPSCECPCNANADPTDVIKLTTNSEDGSVTPGQIRMWFSDIRNSVLNLDILCGIHISSNHTIDDYHHNFKEKLSKSILRSTYRQYKITEFCLSEFLTTLLLSVIIVMTFLYFTYLLIKWFFR
jgi:hypothetical protein